MRDRIKIHEMLDEICDIKENIRQKTLYMRQGIYKKRHEGVKEKLKDVKMI